MAILTPRSTNDILDQMKTEKANQPDLNTITTPSPVSRWNLFLFIVAQAINIFEQILAYGINTIESLVKASKPTTKDYLKYLSLNLFQYDASTPQVIVWVNNAPTYATIDANKRIISRCSITTTLPGYAECKVAKSDPPTALSGPEASAYSAFINELAPPGTFYTVISAASDKIYVKATIKYNGAYAAIISASVQQALNDLYKALASDINFNGKLLVSDVEKTIKNVPGVTDVIMEKVYARPDTTIFANASKIMDLSLGLNLAEYEMYAGYGVEETTAGYTLNDSLTFIVDG